MTPPLTTLIHLTGFATGIVLYTMLLVMTSRPSALPRARAGGISLPAAAAGLGLVWNAGALVLYGLRDFGLGQPAGWLVAVSFAALGFLPAVVVHSTQDAAVVGWRRVIVPVAYTLSACAALLFARGATFARPSETALLVLTGGYLLLVSLVALDGRREGEGSRRRVVTMVALAAFAAAAFHLDHEVGAPESWLVALLGHHGSIPLGLVILYLDYRFAFADLFLRRALTLVFLVATALLLHVGVATPLMASLAGAGSESLLATAGHIGLWVLTALCYPPLHRLSSVIVDRVVLRRGDYRQLVDDLRFVTSQAATEEEALSAACGLVEDALGADRIPVHGRFDAQVRPPAHSQVVLGPGGAQAVRLLVPTTEGPTAIVEMGPLPTGRRLLSDDVALLDRVGTMLARRLDAQRVARERHTRDLREKEILQLAAESELRALRAQLNPHFLFNALTTIGYLVQAAPERALGTLYRLTDLLRAVIKGPAGDRVPLGEELAIVESYLAIERERFQERLQVVIDVRGPLREALVPPLLLQPLVENAIKHGISPLRRGGGITIRADIARHTDGAPELVIVVADTGAGLGAGGSGTSGTGVGVSNIRQRLARLFGERASLSLTGAPDQGTTASLRLPVDPALAADFEEATRLRLPNAS